MTLTNEQKILLQDFFNEIPVVRAYLFGSMARGEAHPESDIDILVELDHSQPIGIKFFSYKADLEELLGKKVDLITTEGLSRYLKNNIEKDKTLLYERVNPTSNPI